MPGPCGELVGKRLDPGFEARRAQARLGRLALGYCQLLVRHRERHMIGDAPRDRNVLWLEELSLLRPELQADRLLLRAQADDEHALIAGRLDVVPTVARLDDLERLPDQIIDDGKRAVVHAR